MSDNNYYTVDDRIVFEVSMILRTATGGTVKGQHSETRTVGEWLGLTEGQLSSLTTTAVQDALDDRWEQWKDDYIHGGWESA
jgi:hypothetical protein